MPVHIFKAERNTIFYKLLKEGVLCVKKIWEGVHQDTGVDNLKVWMLARSLHSKGFLDVTFSWQHYYYVVNDEGIEYLRQKLGITAEDVKPLTRKPRFDLLKDNFEGRRGRGRGMRGGRGRGERQRFGDNDRSDRGGRGRGDRGGRDNWGGRGGRTERGGRAPRDTAPAQENSEPAPVAQVTNEEPKE